MNKHLPPILDLTTLPDGPSPGTRLAALTGLPPGRAAVLSVAGQALFIQPMPDGTVVAYVNRCPHLGVPLDLLPGKLLSLDGAHFVCTTHGALFQVSDGLCVKGPCLGQALQRVAITVKDGWAWVPDAPE
jgi:nitrite reductase/ring-hydroxylating ferredoxin subunit